MGGSLIYNSNVCTMTSGAHVLLNSIAKPMILLIKILIKMFFKMVYSQPLFLYYRLFNMVGSKQCSI